MVALIVSMGDVAGVGGVGCSSVGMAGVGDGATETVASVEGMVMLIVGLTAGCAGSGATGGRDGSVALGTVG